MQQQAMQQQFTGQQSGVTVITQNPPVCDDNLRPSARSQMKVLSILQILMGTTCAIFGIILSVWAYGLIANGIWGGIYFVVVGSIGLGAVRANTRCWLVTVMVLNIICSSVFFLPMLSTSAAMIVILSGGEYCDYDYYSYYSASYSSICTERRTALAFNSLMLVMVIAELVITIWTAVLCCGAVCSCCKSPQRVYNATPVVQAQVVYPSVPATSYGVSMAGQQAMPVQNQNYPYPAAAYQQPVGPQEPPGYYSDNQGNPHYPQEPSKSQGGM